MKYKSHLLSTLVAVALCGTVSAASKKSASPAASPAASPGASAAASPAATNAPRAIPFRGTATAVDQSAKTYTIAGKQASRVFKVTDKTTITKGGSAATMADLTDNTSVTGSYWKQADGSMECKSVKIGSA